MYSQSLTSFYPAFLAKLTLSAALAISCTPMFAQAPHPLDAAEQQRVDTMVKQMTLQQKLDYIGGTGFGVRAVPSAGIPALNMSDGPFGTRSNSGFPSTTYGAGINTAASWILHWRRGWGQALDVMRGHVGFISCLGLG
jgi:beta-glucosidase